MAVITVPPPTGVAATDTANIQSALDDAATAGGGRVVLDSGQNYTVTGVTIDTGVFLDLDWGGLTLAAGANTYLVSTESYASLVTGDTTGGPRDWGIVNGFLDGGKAGQSATDKPVLAIYGRRYTLNNLMIRNGKGTGLQSKWSTSSPFIAPNGFESFVTDLYIHSCDGDGLRFEGPHDAYFQDFYIVKCSVSASAAPLRLPDDSGRANGSNFDKFHIYGGNGYNYGAVLNTAGCRFANFVVEGAAVGQLLLQASQIMIDGAHLYSGGIAPTTVKGIVVGDATHTNVNGLTLKAKIENCGGGGFDLTYMGDHNTIDSHIYFYDTDTTPTLPNLGYVGTPTRFNRILLYVAGNDFLPTVHNINQSVGPLKLGRVSAADTRDLVDVRDQGGTAMYAIDYRGRPRSKGGSTPTVANGAQIGTGGSPATSVSGTDHAGTVTITTGTSGAAAGQLATVTFSTAFGAAPRSVQLTPKSAGAAAIQVYVTTTASAFQVRCGASPGAAATHAFDYTVIGS